ncbi:3-phosphoshikimate 1-carboxyvinyltransferase [Filibacter tadaridae]|uniref:3-phosphoshikimate 1-carboxyvinyltransferase n=1 Tax=Filibacter tadaridae TaxID=2483811 RepID=A0A3P5XN31_9BACL|nr:3-phosphoshikimate 1-carboxyvinyltransferase [Filibacter tadaridae]VDC29209.1 3-phosphoshikimate 1-carboxyvinyltransferase 1 [Filibacter tadaridae]
MVSTKTIHYSKSMLHGELSVPGDKSISHRAVMIGSIAEGTTSIAGFLDGDDCLRTIDIFKRLGVSIERNGTEVTVISPGMRQWQEPSADLYAGNSGTTARLMLGILAGSNIKSVLTGDESLSKRPMDRVTLPLLKMGAEIKGEQESNLLPLSITGKSLTAIDYAMPIASAQVKSAILFAGLNAEGTTSVSEKTVSRDHTERMLEQFGATIGKEDNTVFVKGGSQLHGTTVQVPGDISSAAFFMAATAMIKGSSVTFKGVGLNPTRTGILDILQSMGARVEIKDETKGIGEPSGTVTITYGTLQGMEIKGEVIPRLIDELPIIALLATQASGKTVIKDAGELRVKETDRIEAVTNELIKIGADVQATADGMIIHGPTVLTGGQMASYGDHRIGMMAAIASLVSLQPITIEDPACISISYPQFFEDLEILAVNK